MTLKDFIRKLKQSGPGAMVAAAFIGPGTVTTASIAGADYGYVLLWAILFSVLATIILQEMSARLGVISGMGVGRAVIKKFDKSLLYWPIILLIVVAIFVGNCAYEGGNIVGAVIGIETFGVSRSVAIILIGSVAGGMIIMRNIDLLQKILAGIVGVLGVVFVVAAILSKADVATILSGLFIPRIPDSSLAVVVGLIGTTVVPYNLFLHASAVQSKWSGPKDLPAARLDTVLSITVGGLITMCITIVAAAVLHTQGIEVRTLTDLATGIEPALGSVAVVLISIGFVAAGLSSAITAPLAAAYAITGLFPNVHRSYRYFFVLIGIFVLIFGLIIAMVDIRPTQLILIAQFANGLVLPVIAIFLLWLMNDRGIMGDYVNRFWHNVLGSIVILVTIILGMKSIVKVLEIL